MTVLYDLLVAAKNKLDSPEKWTKGDFAKNSYGTLVDENNPDAVCWCLSGALLSVKKTWEDYYSALNIVEHIDLQDVFGATHTNAPGLSGQSLFDIISFNDASTTTYEDVIKLLDKAIEIAKVEGL